MTTRAYKASVYTHVEYLAREWLFPFRPEEVRCLSVKSPWIDLLASGKKWIELRKRPTSYRGTVVLCSSAQPSRTDDARLAYVQHGITPGASGTPLGHAVAVACLIDSRPAMIGHADGACCAPQAGEWAWIFRLLCRLSTPVPVTGMLGLYQPSDFLVTQLNAQGALP